MLVKKVMLIILIGVLVSVPVSANSKFFSYEVSNQHRVDENILNYNIDEEGVLLSWKPYEGKKNFLYYKVVRSCENENLQYPDDGFIACITNRYETNYKDKCPFVKGFYRITTVTAEEKTNSNVVNAEYVKEEPENINVNFSITEFGIKLNWNLFKVFSEFQYYKVLRVDEYARESFITSSNNFYFNEYTDRNPLKRGRYKIVIVTKFGLIKSRFIEVDYEDEVKKRSGTCLKTEHTERGLELSWKPYTYNDFKYYKVVRSEHNSNLKYPEDGYIAYIRHNKETFYTDKHPLKKGFYRITTVTTNGKYHSNVIEIKNEPDYDNVKLELISPKEQEFEVKLSDEETLSQEFILMADNLDLIEKVIWQKNGEIVSESSLSEKLVKNNFKFTKKDKDVRIEAVAILKNGKELRADWFIKVECKESEHNETNIEEEVEVEEIVEIVEDENIFFIKSGEKTALFLPLEIEKSTFDKLGQVLVFNSKDQKYEKLEFENIKTSIPVLCVPNEDIILEKTQFKFNESYSFEINPGDNLISNPFFHKIELSEIDSVITFKEEGTDVEKKWSEVYELSDFFGVFQHGELRHVSKREGDLTSIPLNSAVMLKSAKKGVLTVRQKK